MKKLLRYFSIAVAATYNFQKRYRELIHLEEGDIVLQVQHSEKDFGPWKIVREVNEIDFVLRNPEGEEIVVYRGHIKKVEGLELKAKW